jgi:hypothetical protein
VDRVILDGAGSTLEISALAPGIEERRTLRIKQESGLKLHISRAGVETVLNDQAYIDKMQDMQIHICIRDDDTTDVDEKYGP